MTTKEQAAQTLLRASDRVLALEIKERTLSFAVQRFGAEVRKDSKKKEA